MIGMDVALRHNAWADDKFLKDLMALPESVLQAEYLPGEWDVAHQISHWVGATTWYRYCLGLGPEERIEAPTSMADVEALRVRLAEYNASILGEAFKDDEVMNVKDGEEMLAIRRSSIFIQTIAHAVEHRTQIAAALEGVGQRLELMRYTVWAWPER